VTGALTSVDMKDFAGHETGRIEVKDSVDDVGHFTHMADRLRCRCEYSLFGRHSSKLRSNGRSASSYELSSNLTRIIGAKRWLADLGKLAAH
jgi:hypothetical protein